MVAITGRSATALQAADRRRRLLGNIMVSTAKMSTPPSARACGLLPEGLEVLLVGGDVVADTVVGGRQLVGPMEPATQPPGGQTARASARALLVQLAGAVADRGTRGA